MCLLIDKPECVCVWVSGRSKPEKPLLLLCLRSSKLPEGMLCSANFLSLNKSLFVGAAKWSSRRRVVAEEVQAGAEEEEAGSGSSLLSIKHSPPAAAAAAQMPPNRVGSPP